MCTVTFFPRRRGYASGYALGMNRDEKLTRLQALPPRQPPPDSHARLYPSEPGGGTWINVNDTGTTLALINWYSIPGTVSANPVSRGTIINAAPAAETPEEVAAAIQPLPLARINPFRLIGIFPSGRKVVEWQWDLKKLRRISHLWQSQQWISSGFDEKTAQRIRNETFLAACRQKTTGTLPWLRRLHRSHAPGAGPFSTCMHRVDAATVSYTEVVVTGNSATMRYHPGLPCEPTHPIVDALAIP